MRHRYRIAEWLFQRWGVDPALAGDILEESAQRSGIWLARQALMALCVSPWVALRDDRTLALRTILIGMGASEMYGLLVQYPWQMLQSVLSHWTAVSPVYILATISFVLLTAAVAGWVAALAQRGHRAVTLLVFAMVQVAAYVWSTFDQIRMLVVDSIDQPRFRFYLANYLAMALAMAAGTLLGGLAAPLRPRSEPDEERIRVK